MSEPSARFWTVALSGAAERDLIDILAWTAENFGARQAEIYIGNLQALIVALASGPDRIGVKVRDEIGPALHTLHVRSIGKRGSHFVLFRAASAEIQVLRILHDRMDLARHVPEDGGA